jgi:hypothetical protein
MNNKKITTMAAAMVALVAVSGVAFSTFAQDDANSANGNKFFGEKRMGAWQNLSDAEKTELEAGREARRAEAEARHEAVEAAMDAGDYNAWLAAHNGDEPILEKINADNFPTLVKAHNYFENGRALMEELGVERGMGKGMGGHGLKGGMRGWGMNQ